MSGESALRIGIVGSGSVVDTYHLPVLTTTRGLVVSWLCDLDLAKARSVATAFGVRATHASLAECADVDIALVAVPVGARRPILEEAFKRGWHVLCEKPFALSPQDHQWIVSAARGAGVAVGVGFMRRYYWSTAALRRLVASGVFGSIQQIVAAEGARLQRTGRGSDFYQAHAGASGGGALMETGSHLVDQLLTVTSACAVTLQACDQVVIEGLEFETTATAAVALPGGATAQLALCVSRLRDTFKGVSVYTDRCQIRIGTLPDSPIELLTRGGELIQQFGAASPRAGEPVFNAFRDEWLDFARRIREDRDDDLSSRLTTQFIDDCYRFAQTSAGAAR